MLLIEVIVAVSVVEADPVSAGVLVIVLSLLT